MLGCRSKRGQTILDYTILVTLVLLGLMLFRGYMQRGISGRWKAAGDAIGYGRQYVPGSSP
ncbi:hypothetical protein ACFL49_02860 [Candidatus Omnitrophota bacterium]